MSGGTTHMAHCAPQTTHTHFLFTTHSGRNLKKERIKPRNPKILEIHSKWSYKPKNCKFWPSRRYWDNSVWYLFVISGIYSHFRNSIFSKFQKNIKKCQQVVILALFRCIFHIPADSRGLDIRNLQESISSNPITVSTPALIRILSLHTIKMRKLLKN